MDNFKQKIQNSVEISSVLCNQFLSFCLLRKTSSEEEISERGENIYKKAPISLDWEENRNHDLEECEKINPISINNSLVWKNVSKWVHPKTRELRLLHNISGRVKAREIVAIMGHSGSGKSTLLNLLSGHYSKGMEGSIEVNGVPITPSSRRKIAYVTQADIFFEDLTVREQLDYAARFYLAGKFNPEEIKMYAKRILEELYIEYCADVQVKYLSGGQRKRCSIGTYLASLPQFLILDEPMSGLDSTSMSSLMQTLRLQADSNVAIVMTMHQPSTYVFYQFDWILFLGGRGRVVYWGKPADCISYLASIELYPLFPNCNPSDFLMDLVCQYILVADGRTAFQYMVDTWETSSPQLPVNTAAAADAAPVPEHPSQMLMLSSTSFWIKSKRKWDETSQVEYTTTLAMQLEILCDRTWKTAYSSIISKWKRIEGVLLSLLTGILWFRTPYQEDSIQTKSGYFFLLLSSFFFAAVFSSLQNFPRDRLVYIKEIRAAQYSPTAYFISKSLVETPVRLVLPCVYLAISYSMVTINPDAGSVMCLVLVMMLMSLIGEALGFAIALIILDVNEAVTAANVMCVKWMLLGGFYTSSLPFFVNWLKYFSPFFYAYQICLQFDFRREMPCSSGLYISDCYYVDVNGYYRVRESLTSDQLLDYLGVGISPAVNFIVLVLFLVLLRAVAYFALILRKHNRTTEV